MTAKKKPTSKTKGRQSPPPPAGKYNRNPLSWLLIVLISITMLVMLNQWQRSEKLNYSPDFLDQVKAGHVESVRFEQGKIIGTFNQKGTEARGGDKPVNFEVVYIESMKDDKLMPLLEQHGVVFGGENPSLLLPLLWNLLPLVLLIAVVYFFFIRNIRAGSGMFTSFGRSKHKMRGADTKKITFADVAGIDEAKEEVAEVIEFLKNPKKFKKIGGRIPRGVLLVGPPGCGKTLLAKAIAGQSDVPFFSRFFHREQAPGALPVHLNIVSKVAHL